MWYRLATPITIIISKVEDEFLIPFGVVGEMFLIFSAHPRLKCI